MACLIKLPTEDSKGVVSFTTQEERYINGNKNLNGKIRLLKSKYVLCLHHNWHNYSFVPNPIFDINLAGEDDLIANNKKEFYQIPLDACNFSREEFTPSLEEKHWDVLFVGNAIYFKDPIQFIKSIREIYDTGKKIRVLYLCPIPKYRFSQRKNIIYNIRSIYEKMFSPDERQLFNLVILKDDYPRFFDRQTLALFYKKSKVFVHTAPDERRCRVAGYAWACGMRVIGRDSVGSILPKEFRKEPFFYRVSEQRNYKDLILKALNDFEVSPVLDSEICKPFSVRAAVKEMEKHFRVYFEKYNLKYNGEILKNNLDFRMGWHHGFGLDSNSVNQTLSDFCDSLMTLVDDPNKTELVNKDYPEYDLCPDRSSTTPQLNRFDTSYALKKCLKDLSVSFLVKSGLYKLIKRILNLKDKKT